MRTQLDFFFPSFLFLFHSLFRAYICCAETATRTIELCCVPASIAAPGQDAAVEASGVLPVSHGALSPCPADIVMGEASNCDPSDRHRHRSCSPPMRTCLRGAAAPVSGYYRLRDTFPPSPACGSAGRARARKGAGTRDTRRACSRERGKIFEGWGAEGANETRAGICSGVRHTRSTSSCTRRRGSRRGELVGEP